MIPIFSEAQTNCPTEPDAQYLNYLDNLVASTPGCEDDLSGYDLNQNLTFNLLLSYGKYGTGPGEFDNNDLMLIEGYIEDVYGPQNISFNIVWNNLDCSDCLTSYYGNDNWPEFFDNTTCIQGHVAPIAAAPSSGIL